MELSKLIEIKKETERFRETLILAIKRINDDGNNRGNDKDLLQSREVGALKRAALDLKQCLTRKLC